MRFALALSLLVLLAGCGRKATRADCELFVDHNIEVQLKRQGVVNPNAVAEEKGKSPDFFKQKVDECVGKRITDGMVACVKAAETTEQIDKCLR